MTSRERVLNAIDHKTPDRVPLDMGGSVMTGIMTQPLGALRRYLGLPDRPPRVCDVLQMLGEVDMDLVEVLGIDVLSIEPLDVRFGLRRENWKPWTLFDSTQVLMPGQFDVEVDEDGGWLLHDEGDPSLPVIARMPKGGYYFDLLDQAFDMSFEPPPLTEMEDEYRKPIPAERLDFLAAEAQRLRPTGKALFLSDWSSFGGPAVGSHANWLCLMATDGDYVQKLFEIRTETQISRLEALYKAVGDSIDIFGIDGFDYGTQRAEMFSPEFFERFHLPFYKSVNRWVHEHTSWKTWKHSCGSIPNILRHLVESGLDCINPVQTSANGMDAEWLKREFGDRITFWGGGVDTQKTLPFGTPEDVYEEVASRIRLFGDGGGFVFNTIHNIQAGTPPENLIAMFQALRDHGG